MGKTNFKNLTTLKIGGEIKYYKEVFSQEELVRVVKFAKEKKIPIFIIGEGSDIVPSDNFFNGLVIKYLPNKLKFISYKSYVLITAEAGILWDDLVKYSVNNQLSGIEKLSGIPGSVGASPIQNIGAYGQELSDTFELLTAYNIEKEKFVKFNKADCNFGYRESIFKTKKFWQKYVIIEVTLKLKKDLKTDLLKIRNEILNTRNEKLEDNKKVPNAGSFFVNPFVDEKLKNTLKEKFPEMNIYKEGKLYKLSAGFLIEKAGWKGKSIGPVKVSDKHALVLTNPDGKGNFEDIKKLADAIINDVNKKFGIKLEPEVQFINI